VTGDIGDLAYALKLLASGRRIEEVWEEAGFRSRKELADRMFDVADRFAARSERPGARRAEENASGPALAAAPVMPRGLKKSGRGLALVAYSDGASSGNPGHAGCGVVLIDQTGEVLLEDHRYLGETTNNVAEYQGAILALTRALELGATRLELRVDSGLVANQIKGGYKVRSASLTGLYRELKSLAGRFDSFVVTQIPGTENRQADRLANLGVASRKRA
jgi:ribonuclease HI